ncbi:MAG: hypothetical protein O7G83_19610, partial [Proteobacteria bacterium]|nr:hypothetical protein [Pseudomonadota bacterium]
SILNRHNGDRPTTPRRRAKRTFDGPACQETPNMSAEALALDYQDRPADTAGNPGDREIADRTTRAINELQDALDAAVLAGLNVEPSFVRIEGRLTQFASRIDSYACKVNLYRRLV